LKIIGEELVKPQNLPTSDHNVTGSVGFVTNRVKDSDLVER
jgi:hypothetical protein